jgi:hypothetical protein
MVPGKLIVIVDRPRDCSYCGMPGTADGVVACGALGGCALGAGALGGGALTKDAG